MPEQFPPQSAAPERTMNALRREVESLHAVEGRRAVGGAAAGMSPAAPPSPDILAPAIAAILAHAKSAREAAAIGETIPPMTRQRGPRRWFARLAARLVLTLGRFVFREQRSFNLSTAIALENAARALEAMGAGHAALGVYVDTRLRDQLEGLAGDIRATETRLHGKIDQLHATAVGGAAEMRDALSAAQQEAHAELERLADSLTKDMRALAAAAGESTTGLDARIDAVAGARESTDAALQQQLETVAAAGDRNVRALTEELRATCDRLRTEVEGATRRLRSDLGEARDAIARVRGIVLKGGVAEGVASATESGTEPVKATQGLAPTPPPDAGSTAFAPFYEAFEARFRGSEEMVLDRLREYLPYVRDAVHQVAEPRWLDLGCGRGEWLRVVAEAGVAARGIDSNEGMVSAARAAGLDATLGDAIGWLRTCPDESFHGVSAFHVAEHLPFAALTEMLAHAFRVLRPRGLLILETPNPENLQVGAHTFHLDPTHQKPLPPGLLEFLVQHLGWDEVRVLRLHDGLHLAPADVRDAGPLDVQDHVTRLLYGPMDYAVLGRKPL